MAHPAGNSKCCFKIKRPNPFSYLHDGCQFIFDEAAMTEVDGRHYCPIHLPLHLGKNAWSDNQKEELGRYCRQACINARDSDLDVIDLTGLVMPIRFDGRHIFCPDNAAILLSHCIFHKGVSLSALRSSRGIYISSSAFLDVSEMMEIDHLMVLGDCQFQRVSFEGSVFGRGNFERCSFPEHARFDKAVFDGSAEFGRATFEGTCTFQGAEFRGGLWLLSGENNGIANKNSAVANNFSACKFYGVADFSDRKFTGATDFSGAQFHCAPKFHNSSLHQDTSFENAVFHDITSQGAARAYRTLKQEMERVRAWDVAGRFFNLEQSAKLAEISGIDRYLAVAYNLISNYGNSTTRPIAAFTVANAAFMFVYFVYMTASAFSKNTIITTENLHGLLRFWLMQMAHPFSALKELHNSYGMFPQGDVSLFIGVLAGMQSITTLTIFALFLLALRRRFKLD